MTARATALALAVALVPACTGGRTHVEDTPAASLGARVCDLPHAWLLRTWRGWNAERGGDVQILPAEGNQVDPGLPHVGPWDEVQRIPMLWYGPGVVPALGAVHRPATLADLAPTSQALIGFDDRSVVPDGRALFRPEGRARLLVTIVWDAVGVNVLEEHPDAWPVLRGLIDRGAWFDEATVGSSPTQTAQSHATIGTGVFPNRHGVLAHRLRVDGAMTTAWEEGSAHLEVETLADRLDRALGNRPLVGLVGTLEIHLGLVGHGAALPGADRDLVVLRQAERATTLGQEGAAWNLPAAVARDFAFLPYVTRVRGFAADVRAVDAADGAIDGRWRDVEISRLLEGFDTPARAPYQTRVIEEVVRREGFGADRIPDLLFTNYKLTDFVAHEFGMESREMSDSVRAQDEALRELVGFLDDEVGSGGWALVLVADHGAAPDPARTGGVVISSGKLREAIEARFDVDDDGRPVVQLVQATQLYLDVDELAEGGSTLEDLSRYVAGLSAGEVAVGGSAADPSEPVFAAAYPSSLMERLPCLPEARA